ncbi:hypothetical protein BC828DRAFT_382860 [Blastocladiella britannica]|nr:hypothetical protein BC828DRAFT_382860 [Blastocladiella britannica]
MSDPAPPNGTSSGGYDDEEFEATSGSDAAPATVPAPLPPQPPATGPSVVEHHKPDDASKAQKPHQQHHPAAALVTKPPPPRSAAPSTTHSLPRRLQSEPHLPTIHPVANRTLAERWDKKRYADHLAAVRDARATVDDQCPGSFRLGEVPSGPPPGISGDDGTSSTNGDGAQAVGPGAASGGRVKINRKKLQMEEERQSEIDMRNRALLVKFQLVADATVREYARAPGPNAQLRDALGQRARTRRAKQIGTIERENRTLLQRLESKSSHYRVTDMTADRAQNLRYLVNIASHKSKYVREMQAIGVLEEVISGPGSTGGGEAGVKATASEPTAPHHRLGSRQDTLPPIQPAAASTTIGATSGV